MAGVRNRTESNGLTANQRRFIPYLLSNSIEAACREAGRSKSTAYKWLREPAFKAELDRVRDEAFSDAVARLKSNVGKAVDTLVELLDSEEEQIQARAAESIIDYASKLNVTADLERRIEALEERLREREAEPWKRH